MAMVKCRECGKDISSNAKSCPHCGERIGGGCGQVVLGVVLLLLVAALASQCSPKDKATAYADAAPSGADNFMDGPRVQSVEQALAHAKPRKDDGAELSALACIKAQRAVKERLKSPSSAKFPGCVMGASEYEIRATPDKRTVWVFGYVDSQNSYGAMLRSKFGVEMRYEPASKKLTPVSVQVE